MVDHAPVCAEEQDACDRVLTALQETFRENDIELPFPVSRVLLHPRMKALSVHCLPDQTDFPES